MMGLRIFVFLAAILSLLSSCQQESGNESTVALSPLESFVAESLQEMRASELSRLEFIANGWEACLGQPWNINEGWARWSLTDYRRVIDYDERLSLQTAQRRAGMDPAKLGGCGAQPDASPQNQLTVVNSDSSWEQQLQIHFTPVGFLRLALQLEARIDTANENTTLILEFNRDGIPTRLVGEFGDDYLLDRISTQLDDTVYGTMPVIVELTDYRSFNGLRFPTRIVQKQGMYPVLDLQVSDVVADTQASAEPENPPRRFGGQEEKLYFEEIGEGVYALVGGGYQSVLVEFDEYLVVLDGLQNDERARVLIEYAKELIFEKPIRYVFVTHAHFDHASGLRHFVDVGATIITNNLNVPFFEQALAVPRLNPDVEHNNSEPELLGVDEFYALDDGSQRVEFYKLNGSTHADDALIAYIPSIKTVVEADLLQPWINPVFGGGDHPFLVWFAQELERIDIDYEQFVPIHRPPEPPLMSRADLIDAVNSNE